MSQVNKVNRRKEFFKISLSEIRNVIEEMKIEVKWTMTADAFEYRESLEIDKKLDQDAHFRNQWTENQLRLSSHLAFDEDEEIQQLNN